jgi:hypothetical protein
MKPSNAPKSIAPAAHRGPMPSRFRCARAVGRWGAALALAAALLGCERSQDPRGASDPEPSPTQPGNKSAPAASRPAPPAPGAIQTAGLGGVFIGVLTRNEPKSDTQPSEYCLDDGYIWRGAAHRMGGVNIMGLERELGAVKAGAVVAIHGAREPSLDAAITRGDPCPDDYHSPGMQLRSDWIASEGGHRSTHAKLAQIAFIRATRHQVLSMHEAVSEADGAVRFRIRNPLDAPLDGVDAKLHYEGGPGKPMPRFIDQPLSLAAGASVEIEAPRYIDADGDALQVQGDRPRRGRYYELRGFQMRGAVGRVSLDLELPL